MTRCNSDMQHKPAICSMQTKLLKVVSSTHTINTQTHHLQVLINTMNLSIECPKLAGSSTLPTILGSANSGSMGTPNSGWLPIEANINSIPDQGAPTNTLLTREQVPDDHRSVRTCNQRGNCGDTTVTTQLCVPTISSGEKGWGSETSNKPEVSQSVCEDRALQNGRSSRPCNHRTGW